MMCDDHANIGMWCAAGGGKSFAMLADPLRYCNRAAHRALILRRSMPELRELIDKSRPIIFWQEKPIIKKQLSVWNLNDLKKIIYEINNIETLCKKKPQLSKIIAFDFFSKICKKANNYS